MTDPSMVPEAPDAAETVKFLRRFADLMSNGNNAEYLRRAAELLETLTRHADALEVECDALKHDIEGHLDITSSVLRERDALGITMQAREAELFELREALGRERSEFAAKLEAHQEVEARLRVAFDREREALGATLELRNEECDQLRRALERERENGSAELEARERQLSELRLALDGAISGRSGREAEANLSPAQRGDQDSAVGEANAVVPKARLRQARAQFEYLARQFIPLGDIASQVMCELAAYNMDLALVAGQQTDHLPVGEVAQSILARAADR